VSRKKEEKKKGDKETRREAAQTIWAVLNPVTGHIAESANVTIGRIGDLSIWAAEIPHKWVQGSVWAALNPVSRDFTQFAHISKGWDGLVRAS